MTERSKSAANFERVGLTILAVTLIAVIVVFDVGRTDVFAAPKMRVALIGAVVLVIVVLAAGSRSRVRWRTTDTLVAAYVSWSLLAFALAPDRSAQWVGERFQFQGMASVVVYAVVYSAARRFVTDLSRLCLLLWWLLAGVTYAAVYGVMQRLDLDPLWNTLLDGRVFSSIGNPNTLASVLAPMLPLGALFVVRGSRPERLVSGAALVVIVLALVFSGSRGGFLATFVGLGVLATVTPRPSARAVEASVAAVLVLIAVAFAAAPVRDQVTATWDRATTALDPSDESRRFHVDGWRVTLAIVADHPVIGVGHERFPEEFPAYRDRVLSEEAVQRFSPYRLESPHNVPLAIAVAAGLPAAALYLALIVFVLRELARLGDDRVLKASLAALIAAQQVADLFVTADLTSAMLFWAVLGGIVSSAEHCGQARYV